jgi:hypothetical protein
MALNPPLDEYIDNTHILEIKEKRKRNNYKKLKQAIESQTKAKTKIS